MANDVPLLVVRAIDGDQLQTVMSWPPGWELEHWGTLVADVIRHIAKGLDVTEVEVIGAVASALQSDDKPEIEGGRFH